MTSKIFHNGKFLEKNLIIRNTYQETYPHQKKNVDVNKLLNRVKINEQNEKKKKINFLQSRNIFIKSNGNFFSNYKIDFFQIFDLTKL